MLVALADEIIAGPIDKSCALPHMQLDINHFTRSTSPFTREQRVALAHLHTPSLPHKRRNSPVLGTVTRQCLLRRRDARSALQRLLHQGELHEILRFPPAALHPWVQTISFSPRLRRLRRADCRQLPDIQGFRLLRHSHSLRSSSSHRQLLALHLELQMAHLRAMAEQHQELVL